MRATAALLTLLVSSANAQPASPPPLQASVAQITGGIYTGRGYELLTDLSEHIGPRLSGTKSYAAAVTWATRELKAAGAKDVHTEKSRLAATWERGSARGRILGATPRTLDVMSLGWAPSTPTAGITAPVVVLEHLHPSTWRAVESKIKGAIVVIVDRDRANPKWSTWWVQSIPLLATAGARAVVFGVTDLPNNIRGRSALADRLLPVPTASIGYEDASYIRRHATEGLRMELSITNTVGKAADIESVIGEIKGSDASAGWLLVSGHLDSWDAGTGTQDNGSGVITVIETARALAAIGGLKRTVRFALWAGEEQFLVGARAYVTAHASDLDSCVAILNSDSGAGHVTGWTTDGRDDIKDALQPTADQYLRGLGGAAISSTYFGGSDHEAFALAGVPTLMLTVDETNYNTVHHKVADTLEKVDVHAFLSGVAVTATTAYVLAMSTSRLGPRLDHDGIERLLVRNGTADFMSAMAVWK